MTPAGTDPSTLLRPNAYSYSYEVYVSTCRQVFTFCITCYIIRLVFCFHFSPLNVRGLPVRCGISCNGRALSLIVYIREKPSTMRCMGSTCAKARDGTCTFKLCNKLYITRAYCKERPLFQLRQYLDIKVKHLQERRHLGTESRHVFVRICFPENKLAGRSVHGVVGRVVRTRVAESDQHRITWGIYNTTWGILHIRCSEKPATGSARYVRKISGNDTWHKIHTRY